MDTDALNALAPSRRGLLTGAAAMAAAAALPDGSLAQAAGRRIDVHHHFNFYDVIAGITPGGPRPQAVWDLQKDLEDMDRGGVATALLSGFAPVDAPDEPRRRAARAINEAAARLSADHRQFALLANLPLPDIEGSLREIEYGLDTLKAHGIGIYTNTATRWLGDSHFDPVWSELNRRKAVVFVHPVSAACCRNVVAGVPDVLIEFGADSTRCIASLIFNGTTTRFPDIRFIFCHGGGATMAVIERFLGGTRGEIAEGIETKGVDNFPAKQPPGGVLNELRKLHYDTAQATNRAVLSALKTVIPTSQIVYGTDFQYQTAEVTTRQLQSAGVFTPAELQAIGRGNALRLFPRLA
jgi:6-methylsalicylate decarboxylase